MAGDFKMEDIYTKILTDMSIKNEDIIKCMVAIPYRILIDMGLIESIDDYIDSETIQKAIDKVDEYIEKEGVKEWFLMLYNDNDNNNINDTIKGLLKALSNNVTIITKKHGIKNINYDIIIEKINTLLVNNLKEVISILHNFAYNNTTVLDYLNYAKNEIGRITIVLFMLSQLTGSFYTLLNVKDSFILCKTCPVKAKCNIKNDLDRIKSTILLLKVFIEVHDLDMDINL